MILIIVKFWLLSVAPVPHQRLDSDLVVALLCADHLCLLFPVMVLLVHETEYWS